MWAAAGRLKRRYDAGQNIVLLHLGDHDPSGKDMSRDIVERLELFGVEDIVFRRLALNMDQIDQYGPPPNPAKLTDSRAMGYIREFGRESWELDALEPQVISDLIQENVETFRDDRAYSAVVAREERERSLLKDLSRNWSSVAENWDDIKDEYC